MARVGPPRQDHLPRRLKSAVLVLFPNLGEWRGEGRANTRQLHVDRRIVTGRAIGAEDREQRRGLRRRGEPIGRTQLRQGWRWWTNASAEMCTSSTWPSYNAHDEIALRDRPEADCLTMNPCHLAAKKTVVDSSDRRGVRQ